MKCPHCNKELDLLPRAYKAVKYYSNDNVLTNTECCNKPIKLKLIESFEIHKYEGERKHDDWGVKFKQL